MTIAGGMSVASGKLPIKVSLVVMILTVVIVVCEIISIVKSINK